MPTSYSDLLRIAKQATGENNNTWGNIVNANSFEMFEDAIAGMATLSLAGSGTYTLSTNNGASDEARVAVLKGTGLMTALRNIVVPSTTKTYIVHNATTGNFDMVVKTASGTGVNVAMGVTKTVYCDGTNVLEVSTNTTPADGIIAKDCVTLTSASSPYSVTSTDSGKMLVVDTSGGAVIVNLPTVASKANPFNFGVYKLTSDANTITINRSGSDVIGNGNTSLSIARQEGTFLLVDPDPATDRWVPVGFGATVTTGQQQSQTFTGGTDYTAGTTTTLTITTTPIAPSSAALDIYFDGVYQHSSEWSYNPSTGLITFGSAIPLGVLKVFCKWQSVSLPIGTPSDGTVTPVKMNTAGATVGQVFKADGVGGGAYGNILQIVGNQTGAVATGTTILPFDDTIPQNTEGDQYLSQSITPRSATSKLMIEVNLFIAHSTSPNISIALFQDSNSSAIAAISDRAASTGGNGQSVVLRHYMTSGTTSPTTFNVRAGCDSAGTTTVNGVGGARRFGGVCASSITITEILP